jgi:predicted regulator of Ras-like GTPase activity (Roadblock/LC7/MglB family)
MAIKGRLEEMALPTLIQHVCNAGESARLRVEREEMTARLHFAEGDLVHAELGDQVGEEAVYRVLAWEDGDFELTKESGNTSPSRTIETPWSALIMEGLQRHDEAAWETSESQEDYDMPENIRDILVDLGGQAPGFIAASVVGMDGLGIAEFSVTGADTEAINAQMTLLVKLVDTTVTKLGAGTVEDHLLTTDKAFLLVRFLEDQDYYLGIAVDKQATNLGNLRLNSRIYAKRVNAALPH